MSNVGPIIAFVIFCVGMIMFIVAFGSPWWFETEQWSGGMWRICSRANTDESWDCERTDRDFDKEMSPQIKSTKAMLIISLLMQCGCAAAFGAALVGKLNGLFAGAGTVGASIFTMIAVCLYGTEDEYENNLGWAYILACVSSGVHFVAGIVGLIMGAVSRK